MRVAVTGGAGYIGSLLVKNLLDGGHEVSSIDNLSIGDYRYVRGLSQKGLRVLEGDIRDGEAMDDALTGVDTVAHLAALPGLVLCEEKPEEAISTNVFGTHQVLEAAKRNGISRVVFCSSASVYGVPQAMPVTEEHCLRPLNLYGVTKLAGEKLMETYHDNHSLETVSLRFGNIYGVGLYTRWVTVIPKFVRLGLLGKPLTVYGDGTSSRDFVHVEDITQALTLAMTAKGIRGEVYNVGSEPTTIGRIAEMVSDEVERTMGRRPKTTNLPPRPGETKEFSYDLSKIENSLGFTPRWTLKRGIRQLVDYAMKNP